MTGKTKTCYVCKETKKAPAFQKDRSQPDGLQRRCRRCRNLNLTLKELTGIHGLKKTPCLSDFPIGLYKEETFKSVFKQIYDVEIEKKVLESRRIALGTTAMQLLKADKITFYTHPDFGTMSIEGGKLKVQLSDNFEVSEEDE